jgi:anaerobic ribonucleoside-triphosphate reductase
VVIVCSLECAVYNKTTNIIRVCRKCGEQYTLNDTTTTEYCNKCKSSNHDSYSDLIKCFEDHDLRDLKPLEHH